MAFDIQPQTLDAWWPEAGSLFQDANIQVDPNEMSDLYAGISTIFLAYFNMNSRTDYDAPLRAWGCAREVIKMVDSKRRIAAWAYIITLKKCDDPSARLMGQQIEEALQKFFMTGVLPLTIKEFYEAETG